MMKYKSYTAKIEFDDDAVIFHGEVLGINAVITFQAKDAESLKIAFKDSVDDYLEWCLERGTEPDKPYSGNLHQNYTNRL